MEKKYIKSNDVSSILIRDKKEINVDFHPELREKKNFWGTITQKYRPAGYQLGGWGSEKLFSTVVRELYVEEYNKRCGSYSIDILDGKFCTPPSVTIAYKSANAYANTYYFKTYDEAVECAERLAEKCNLIPIIQ